MGAEVKVTENIIQICIFKFIWMCFGGSAVLDEMRSKDHRSRSRGDQMVTKGGIPMAPRRVIFSPC